MQNCNFVLDNHLMVLSLKFILLKIVYNIKPLATENRAIRNVRQWNATGKKNYGCTTDFSLILAFIAALSDQNRLLLF